jgi:hypothetical protein
VILPVKPRVSRLETCFLGYAARHTPRAPTRAERLRDGVLIDVSSTARKAGPRWPVALTAAWAKCVAVPPGVYCQDEAGRLWDVVYLLRCAIGWSQGQALTPEIQQFVGRVINHAA